MTKLMNFAMRSAAALAFAFALTLTLLPARAAGGELLPVPLNDHARLGQEFSSSSAILGLSVTVPSWSDAEGGLTLSLWESPGRKKLLARKAFTAVPDNASVDLALPQPLPAGRYYWEVDQRTGRSGIGLYAEQLAADAPEPAWIDGRPDPRQRFRFRAVAGWFQFADVPAMLVALQRGPSRGDREDACRELAALGTPECIGPLAALLKDPDLAQWARYALEPMPWPAAGAALRSALPALQGSLAVGVIHSLGARRDAQAVPLLRERLTQPDAAIAAAAADALGKIGMDEASAALLAGLDAVPAGLRHRVAEGLLTAGRRRLDGGDPANAASLFEEVRRRRDLPKPIVCGALQGLLEARGEAGLPLLLDVLRGGDPAETALALGAIQQSLPGTAITQALAGFLSAAPAPVLDRLVQALGNRADPAALAGLLPLARHGDPAIRLAAVQAFSAIGSAPAAGALAGLVRDPDAKVASAAETALGSVPGKEADAEALGLLRARDRAARLAGARISGVRSLDPARPDLLAAARDPDGAVRQAALRVLTELAQPADLAALLDLFPHMTTPADRGAVEAAAAEVCGRAGDQAASAAELTRRLGTGETPVQVSCLRLLAGLGDRWGRGPVLQAAAGENPELRMAAYRLLHQWQDPEAAPDLLRLAAGARDPSGRTLCLRAALRLAGAGGLPSDRALALCREAMASIRQAEEKKLLLSALGNLGGPEALELAWTYGNDSEVRPEAAAAVLAIAERLGRGPQAARALPPLQDLAAHPPTEETGRRARAVLSRLR